LGGHYVPLTSEADTAAKRVEWVKEEEEEEEEEKEGHAGWC